MQQQVSQSNQTKRISSLLYGILSTQTNYVKHGINYFTLCAMTEQEQNNLKESSVIHKQTFVPNNSGV